MKSPDWWNEFFAGPWSQIQAGGYPAEQTSAECNLIGAALRLKDGVRVLDIPCGLGRHCVGLARCGFRMSGLVSNPNTSRLQRQMPIKPAAPYVSWSEICVHLHPKTCSTPCFVISAASDISQKRKTSDSSEPLEPPTNRVGGS